MCFMYWKAHSNLKYELGFTKYFVTGTTFISPQWNDWCCCLSYQNSLVFFLHILTIFGGNENVVIEIAILFNLVWLHLSGICMSKAMLSSAQLTTFWPQTSPDQDDFSTTQPHWHMPDLVCVPCYKRKSFLCLLPSLSKNSSASSPAGFCFIYTCHKMHVGSQSHLRATRDQQFTLKNSISTHHLIQFRNWFHKATLVLVWFYYKGQHPKVTVSS